jgi:hypothetical protein
MRLNARLAAQEATKGRVTAGAGKSDSLVFSNVIPGALSKVSSCLGLSVPLLYVPRGSPTIWFQRVLIPLPSWPHQMTFTYTNLPRPLAHTTP